MSLFKTKKPVAELRRELIEDGVSPDSVSLKKAELILAAQSYFCSRYRDCKQFDCARCKSKGVNFGTFTSVTCETCDYVIMTYQNGIQWEQLDVDFDPYKESNHPDNEDSFNEAVERLTACATHAHLASKF